ncbi:MAG: hypothetical protein ACRCTL_18180 [Pseudomonas sp.]
MNKLLIAALLIIFSQAIYASKEASLDFNSFYFSSEGIGESGQITIKGSQTSEGIQSLTVNAFDKEYAIPKEQLSKLGTISANQIHISYEYGRYGAGGRTLYVRLTRGFVGGSASGKILALRANGRIRIKDYKSE